MSITNYISQHEQLVNEKIDEALIALKDTKSKRLIESMRYSLEAGGKRLRPILLFATYEAFEKNLDKAYSTAVALEFIHTYSLIHDDLPAMDDDDLRRGKPTNHKVYDEATAILAGDALLTYSFEWIARDSLLTAEEKATLIHWLSKASGPRGMVAGQMLDLKAEEKEVAIDELENIHRLKTGQLITFPIIAGAYLGQATDEQIKHLQNFAHYIGLVFQIQDDILDIIGDEKTLGKPVGSDLENEKSTYPALLGLEGAKEHRDQYVKLAKQSLVKANMSESTLESLAQFLTERKY